MSEQIETATWVGWSGQVYEYTVFGNHEHFIGGGNFIWARRDDHDPRRWIPVYVGAADNLQTAFSDATIFQCAVKHGATALHVRIHLGDDLARQREAKDLRDMWRPVCNQVPMGV